MRHAALCLLICAPLFAASKNDYQDAVLVGFKTVSTGNSCSGNTDGQVNDDGKIDASTTAHCANTYTRLYTVSVQQQTFVLRPTLTKKGFLAAMGTMGWSEVLGKGSVLSNQLPGSHILVRSESNGIHVRVGNRESKFEVVETK